MKKTILKVIILAFFILLHKNTVYAGETTFFMEVNEPPQDALIIGRVSEVHNNQNYISIDEAAEYIGIKTVTLRNWIKKKPDIPAHRVGKLWKFKRSELDAWIASGKSAE